MPAKVNSQYAVPSLRQSFAVLLAIIVVLFGAYLFGRFQARRGFLPMFEGQIKKERLVSEIRLNLQTSVEAEKNAVMAETDEASEVFAQQARSASALVEESRRQLGQLIDMGRRPDEISHFGEFSTAWKRYQELDREILDLAVENTNLKALRLSFTSANEALQRMEARIAEVVEKSDSPTQAVTIQKFTSRALIAALKIHALQSRHIVEAHDAEMDRIEAEMKVLDASAREGLSTISATVDESLKTAIQKAQSAYEDFQEVNKKVLELSRRNSNVRSLAMSLDEKRKATAYCQHILNALHESIQSDHLKATR